MHSSRRNERLSRFAPLGRETILRDDDVSVLKMERRSEHRSASAESERLAASYTNGVDRCGITHLDVFDRSPSGMGVTTCTRIEPGMRVTISPDGRSAPWMPAIAVRCVEMRDGGFRVGLRFCRLAAA